LPLRGSDFRIKTDLLEFTSCGVVDDDQHSRGTYYLHLQSKKNIKYFAPSPRKLVKHTIHIYTLLLHVHLEGSSKYKEENSLYL
jgi:hypothetical protein